MYINEGNERVVILDLPVDALSISLLSIDFISELASLFVRNSILKFMTIYIAGNRKYNADRSRN